MVLDGNTLSRRILARLARRKTKRRVFAAVFVGNDPSSAAFLRRKEEVASRLGVPFRLIRFAASAQEGALVRAVRRLSREKAVGGIVIQLPLPPAFNRARLLAALDPAKDVDCLTDVCRGAFISGAAGTFVPPAAGALREVLRAAPLPARGIRAAVIGAGYVVGQPALFELLRDQRVAEVTVFERTARRIRGRLRAFDLIVSAVGSAGLFSAGDVRHGATIIDFGYDRVRGKTTGDFSVYGQNAGSIFYTPVPGGMGPLVIAKLFENFYALRYLKPSRRVNILMST